jgi:hypothetical protein
MKNACQDLIQQKNSENRIQNLQNGVAFHKSIPSFLILDLTKKFTGVKGGGLEATGTFCVRVQRRVSLLFINNSNCSRPTSRCLSDFHWKA